MKLVPTSMTTAPGLSQDPLTKSGCPIAATTISACLIYARRVSACRWTK